MNASSARSAETLDPDEALAITVTRSARVTGLFYSTASTKVKAPSRTLEASDPPSGGEGALSEAR
jgi:hypothetical protein